MKQPIIALMYDFDNTLACSDMQNFTFIPSLGLTPGQFWSKTNDFNKTLDMDKVLCYLYLMVKETKERGIKLTREYLNDCAKGIKYFEGVTTWFDRINEYAKERGCLVEHYIISSGNLEILEATTIAKHFKKLFGCEFIFDAKTKEAIWPKTIVNYTLKTQDIYRINKGTIDDNDDKAINEKQKVKRIPFSNMIYIGDGLTDVPAMIQVKENGGTSIAVYPEGKRDLVLELFEDERVNFVCKANYTKDSELEKITKLIIDTIAIKTKLEKKVDETKKEL